MLATLKYPEQEKKMRNPESLLSSPWVVANDVARWRKQEGETVEEAKKRATEELTGASFEQREGEWCERINWVVLAIQPGGFSYLNQKRLGWRISREGPENEATYQIWRWAESVGYRDSQSDEVRSIWISPSGRGYTESRFNVYEVSYLLDGRKVLFLWSIPTPHTPKQCLEIANQIQKHGSKDFRRFEDPEVLRRTPITFKPPEGVSWTDFLSNSIDMPKVWQAIEAGEPQRKKQEALGPIAEIVDDHYEFFSVADDVNKQIAAGATVEWAIQKRLQMRFIPVGGHGMSNMAAFNRLFQSTSEIDSFANKKENGKRKWVEKCPYCHSPIKKYMSSGDLLVCCGNSVP